MNCETDVALIITVVKKGWAEAALRASVDAGAQGGTVMYGRGIGMHERKTILGMRIEPEKEILITAVKRSLSDQVLVAISKAAELDKPGQGIAMVLPLDKVIGRVHMIPEDETYFPLSPMQVDKEEEDAARKDAAETDEKEC